VPGRLAILLERVGFRRVAVAGDVMVDKYVWGEVSRISPEAPVPILNFSSEDMRLGGAGSVANDLHSLGAEVRLCGVVGSDEEGAMFLDEMRNLSLDTSLIFHHGSRPTTLKTRIIARTQQLLRLDREKIGPFEDEVYARLWPGLADAIASSDIVLISDYHKGFLTPTFVRQILDLAKAKGKRVLVDPPRSSATAKYAGATALVLNRIEAQVASGVEIVDRLTLRSAARKLLETLGLEFVVITRDKDGMSLFKATGEEADYPTRAREVYDVTGAGDMVISVLGYVLAGGHSIEDAIQIANVAAGLEVGRLGSVPIQKSEIVDELRGRAVGYGSKIKSVEELVHITRQLRAMGRKIVFTNGCFDVLHDGHVQLLSSARRQGDCLIVGMNSDASVRMLKGPSRPLRPQEERAKVLAALQDVDYLTIFDERTPVRLIDKLRPDVLVKGSDYSEDQVVGADLVKSYGGTVVLVPIVPGVSTTRLVEDILHRYKNDNEEKTP